MSQIAVNSTLAPRGLSFTTIWAWAVARFDVIKQRRALRHLDDAALSDIGISYREALREARKPFWM